MPPPELLGLEVEVEVEASSDRHSLDGLLDELKRAVRRAFAEGRRGVAVELLARHPELLRRRLRAYELLYEEYQLLAAVDGDIDVEAFAGEFTWFPEQVAKAYAARLYKSTLTEALLGRHLVPWPEPGDRLAGFEIVDLLGAGAAARVYLAKEPALGNRLVAIKASPKKTSEAETLGKLLHPNIVPVHSVTTDGASGLTLVCMPFLGRATLHDVCWRLFCEPDRPPPEALKRTELPAAAVVPLPRRGQAILDAIGGLNQGGDSREGAPRDPLLARRSYVDAVVHLAAQMADALAYTHATDTCHGDLKPANVLMAPDGRPMLLDFNLANGTDRVEFDVGGTLHYMAPERLIAVATAREAANDPRSDLFSLGVIVYQALCGAHPFGRLPDGPQCRAMARWMWERQRTRPLSLGDRNGDIDPALARLVERCLAFDVADRPQTAGKLATELRRHVSRPRRARRWVRAHRWLVTAAAAAMILVLGAAAHQVVNRPPYAQRVFDQGMAAYVQEDYSTAEKLFTDALDHGGKTWQAYLRRGLARQHMGDHAAALDDYQAAFLMHPTRELEARIGDCFCREPKTDSAIAIAAFRAAIDQGLNRAEVYNNLGVCLTFKSEFEAAYESLTSSIALAPDAPVPYYNRAILEWARAARATRSVGPQGLDDIDRATSLGASSADVLTYAAQMHAYEMGDDGDRRRKALDYLAEAIQQGAKVEQFNQHPVLGTLFEELRGRRGFLALVAAGAQRTAVPTTRLLDLPDDLDR